MTTMSDPTGRRRRQKSSGWPRIAGHPTPGLMNSRGETYTTSGSSVATKELAQKLATCSPEARHG